MMPGHRLVAATLAGILAFGRGALVKEIPAQLSFSFTNIARNVGLNGLTVYGGAS